MAQATEDHSRRQFYAAIAAARQRLEIETNIERLIAQLDAMDGDCDLEDDEIEDDAAEAGIADWDGLDEQFGRAAA